MSAKLVFVAFALLQTPSEVRSTRPLTWIENVKRQETCGTTSDRRNIVDGLATDTDAPWAYEADHSVDGQDYGSTGTLISPWHGLIQTQQAVSGFNDYHVWRKPGTKEPMSHLEVQTNCRGGIMELHLGETHHLRTWDGTGWQKIPAAAAWYLGHCNPFKRPEGVILVEYKNTLALTPVCVASQKNAFSDAYMANGAKMQIQVARYEDVQKGELTVTVVECDGKKKNKTDSYLCTTGGLNYNSYGAPVTALVKERVKAFAIVDDIPADNKDVTNPVVSLPIRKYMTRICKLSGVCQN